MRCRGRGVSVWVMLVLSTGCTSYRPMSLPAPDALNRTLPPNSRITTTNGAVYHLYNAQVEGDSVIGNADVTRARVAIATRDVHSVETRGVSAGKSAAAGVGVGLLVAVVAALVGIVVLAALWSRG